MFCHSQHRHVARRQGELLFRAAVAWLALWLLAAAEPAAAQVTMAGACARYGGCPTKVGTEAARDGFALRLLTVSLRIDYAKMMFGGFQGLPPGGAHTPEQAQQMSDQLTGDGVLRDDPQGQLVFGNVMLLQGRFDDARRRYASVHTLIRGKDDPEIDAAVTANLGVLAAAQGRYAEAREQLTLALQRYEAILADPGQALARATPPAGAGGAPLGAGPDLRSMLGNLNALVAASMKNEGARRLTTAVGLAATLVQTNLANLAGQLGQYAEADGLLQQALERAEQQPDAAGRREVLYEYAVLYRALGKTDEADDYRQQADAAAPLDQITAMLPAGLVALGSSTAQAALDSGTAEAVQKRPSHYAEAAHAQLQAEAAEREQAGDVAGAITVYGRAAMLAAVIANPERERVALAHLQRLHAAQGQVAVAIYYGKRAVNIAQRLRGELRGMDRQARQAYLADKKRSYALLASLLLSTNRLAEAEQVLRLLKEDEGQQLRETLAAGARGVMPYTTPESQTLARYDALAAQTRSLEQQRLALRQKQFGSGGFSDSQEEQERFFRLMLDNLGKSIDDLERAPEQMEEKKLRPIRAIAAKARRTRTAQEQRTLAEFHSGAQALLDMYASMEAGLRALKRNSKAFVKPLSPTELAQVDSFETQMATGHAELTRQLAFLGNEPRPPELPEFVKSLATSFGPSIQFQQQWIIDRQVEELDQQRDQLDAALPAGLAPGSKGSTQAAFSAADTALLEGGRKLLGSLPAGTVAIYYLSGDEQLDMLLVSRDGRRASRQPVARGALEQRIQALRQQLQNPRLDPRAAAQALHALLIAPFADALREAQAKTLMLSLDGQLRYLPFAALHDGEAWLAQRYALDLYTTAAPAALAAAPAAKWRAAAFGSSAGGEGFAPLPAVRAELEGVVRDPALRTQGALPGTIRLDRNFTAATLRSALRDQQNVVHIASHFAFVAGDPTASFLLLGDGSRLSLAEMTGPDFRFDRVDLVTLSACETALSGNDSFGQEVEGLGTLLQGQGAAAVLATLWSVADDSTATFMRALYGLREQRGLSRAQALREAQLAFIGGAAGGADVMAPATAARRGASRPGAAGAAEAFGSDPQRPYAHPYFWAPFVLMGNWL